MLLINIFWLGIKLPLTFRAASAARASTQAFKMALDSISVFGGRSGRSVYGRSGANDMSKYPYFFATS